MAVTHGSATPPPLEDADDALLRCLASLLQAIEAADVLGIPTDTARDVHADGIRRLGFPSDAYVLALVGGTGVGKSSLLNALAGSTVSAASARRPTTAEPVGRRAEAALTVDPASAFNRLDLPTPVPPTRASTYASDGNPSRRMPSA